jgi:hypothetical protein
MISTARFRFACAAVLLVLAGVRAPAAAGAPADATLFRVFLKDGSTLVSYGEFSRVADKVVLSLPITIDPPELQLVSIPSDSVDWQKTDEYAESARAARYATTRGPEDYALLGAAVSRALSDIAQAPDAQRKVAMAIEARQNVMKWIAEHYGYRAADVSRMAGLFDDIVAEARRGAGQSNFDLSLIAATVVPPVVPLMAAPDTSETLRQGFAAAMLVDDASERTSLLTAIHDALAGRTDGSLSGLKASVAAALRQEERTTADYAALSARVMRSATRYAARADVRSLTTLAAGVLQSDDKLGHKRPQQIASLLASVDAKLDAARRLRLARDQWAARQPVLQAYRRAVQAPSAALRLSKSALEAIQQMAGPSPAILDRASTRLNRAAVALSDVTVPPEMDAAHALLKGAMQLAVRAVEGRRSAVRTGRMPTARDASAAAAGALILSARAAEELQKMSRVPQPK